MPLALNPDRWLANCVDCSWDMAHATEAGAKSWADDHSQATGATGDGDYRPPGREAQPKPGGHIYGQ